MLDAWKELYLYVGREVGGEVWGGLFGLGGLPAEAHQSGFKLALALESSDMAGRLLEAVQELCAVDGRVGGGGGGGGGGSSVFPPLQVVAAGGGSPLEAHFTKLLVDDRQKNDQSYVEYLCLVHKQIQNRLAGR